MKHLIRAFIALGTVMCLAASAAPVCTPAEPADFEGSLTASAPGGQSVAASWFQQNGCDWSGQESLDGTDAQIFDVAGKSGTGTVTAGITAGLNVVMTAYFLSDGCEAVGEAVAFAADNQNTYALAFPEGAKWLVVHQDDGQNPSGEVSFKVHYDGKACAPVKKKKKRRR